MLLPVTSCKCAVSVSKHIYSLWQTRNTTAMVMVHEQKLFLHFFVDLKPWGWGYRQKNKTSPQYETLQRNRSKPTLITVIAVGLSVGWM